MDDMFYSLRMDIADFYDSVKLLSDSVNRSGVDWNDGRYEELAEKIQEVAALASQVIRAGEESKAALTIFERIAQEE